MTHQFLSEKMCRLLSSLVPGFEGHWVYVYWGTSKTTSIYCRSAWGITAFPENGDKIICPAWQAEDLLRNWSKIVAAVKKNPLPEDHINKYGRGADVIVLNLIQGGDTAYQKIEEYLYKILK